MIFSADHHHYHAALDCYNYLETRADTHGMDGLKGYHQLVLLRLGYADWNTFQIIDWFEYMGMKRLAKQDEIASQILFDIVSALRVNKEFESAILLVKMFGVKYWEPFQQSLSLALTYLEGYRLNHIFTDSNDLYCFQGYNFLEDFLEDKQNTLHLMVLKLFLLHKNFDEGQNIEQAIALIKSHLMNTDLPFFGLDDYVDACHICGQAVTIDDVQFVCGGCHVACYCSLDHQRITWKKDAIYGMRVGHEILCPLYKACRKWAATIKHGDAKKQLKMEKRLDSACLKFLLHDLGLKDRCFPSEKE